MCDVLFCSIYRIVCRRMHIRLSKSLCLLWTFELRVVEECEERERVCEGSQSSKMSVVNNVDVRHVLMYLFGGKSACIVIHLALCFEKRERERFLECNT